MRPYTQEWFHETPADDPKVTRLNKDVIVVDKVSKDVYEVDNDFWLVPVKILDHSGPLECRFPVENRLHPVQTVEDLRDQMRHSAKSYAVRPATFSSNMTSIPTNKKPATFSSHMNPNPTNRKGGLVAVPQSGLVPGPHGGLVAVPQTAHENHRGSQPGARVNDGYDGNRGRRIAARPRPDNFVWSLYRECTCTEADRGVGSGWRTSTCCCF